MAKRSGTLFGNYRDRAARLCRSDALGRIVNRANDLNEFVLAYLGQTGQITSLQGTGVGTSWTYDTNTNDRRLLSISNGPGTRTFGYTTTPENDITGVTETLGSTSQSWTDSYDKADRLLTATLSTGATFGYSYDKAGNITGITTGSTSTAIGYTKLNQVKIFKSKTFVYDANGNLTQDDLRTYQYDAENRLIGIGFIGKPGLTEAFRYDGRNHRIASVVQNGSVSTETHDFWCGETLCQERNSRDKVIRRYFAEGEEAPAAGTILYYGRDQLGTVRDVLSAATGSPLASTDYDPYGNQIASSGQTITDFQFADLFGDATSSLSLANFRAYDSRLGRWNRRDPIAEAGGFNLYAYVGNNPVNANDSLGLANLNLFLPGSAEYSYENAWNPAGVYSVSGHGNPQNVLNQSDPSNQYLETPQQMAHQISFDPAYHAGEPVVLHACSTGHGTNYFAQQLANALGAPVQAPTEDAATQGVAPANDPQTIIGEHYNMLNGGHMQWFSPGH